MQSLFDKIIERVSRWETYRNIVTRCLLWKYGGKKDLVEIQADAENLIFKHFQAKMKNYLSSFQGDIYYKDPSYLEFPMASMHSGSYQD